VNWNESGLLSSIVAIPARLESTRFPRKVLADIHGKSMLWYVYHGVAKAESIDEIWVLTDSAEVFEEVTSWGGQAMMTAQQCPSGTDRIASVIQHLKGDIIINVQADEPLIESEIVESMVDALESSEADVVTPVFRLNTFEELTDVTINKVVRSTDQTALYFSHSPIPHVRDVRIENWLSETEYWGHMGVYGYRRQVLEGYLQIPQGKLELVEKLEQLRLLEAGVKIKTVEINYQPIGVDVPEDLERVKNLIDPNTYLRKIVE